MKKLLFITAQDIYDEYGNGGAKCAKKNYELFIDSGLFEVYVYRIYGKNYKKIGKANIDIRANNIAEEVIAAIFGYKRIMPWRKKQIHRYINDMGFDLVFLDESILGNIIDGIKKIPTITFFHNCEFDYAMNKVKSEGIVYLLSAYASKINELNAVKSNYIMCLNNRDAIRIKELYNRNIDLFIPVSFSDLFDNHRLLNIKYEKKLLFLGSLFGPNIDGIEWFIKEVFNNLENIELIIAGKGFEQKKREYENIRGIKVLGTVNDTSELYYSHSAVVLPIRYGSGMKVKTCEAMMYGRRIFASDEALEGYEVEGVSGITRCNTAKEYIDAINKYFDKGEYKAYEEDVRKLFLEKYETSVVERRFNEFLNGIL